MSALVPRGRTGRWLAIGWLLVASALGIAMYSGGDLSIEAGVVFLIWTVPIGPLWQFHLYQQALLLIPAELANTVGTTAVIAVSYGFWFFLVPRLIALARK